MESNIKLQKLGDLARKIETKSLPSKDYLYLIDEYNLYLDDLLDNDEIKKPLSENLRIDYEELSSKYVEWERNWHINHPNSIENVIDSVESICIVKIISSVNSDIVARKIKLLKGEISNEIKLKTIVPWGSGYNNWFKEGELNLIFFKEGLTPWTSLCRVPIKNLDGKQTVFFIHQYGAIYVYPSILETFETEFEGMKATAFELSKLEEIVSGYC